MSELSRARIRSAVDMPNCFVKNNFALSAIKTYSPFTALVETKIHEQFPHLTKDPMSTHFVEIQDAIMANTGSFHYVDKSVEKLNLEFRQIKKGQKNLKVGVLMLGNAAPGMNNVIDGLLKFQQVRGNLTVVGFMNGLKGLKEDNVVNVTEDSYAPYRNLGGCDYLGNYNSRIMQEDYAAVVEACKKHGLTGLVLVGATHTMTDAAQLAEFFLYNDITTRVVAVPATLDGNVRHGFFQCSLGFDTASKVYSQLVGNMLTDSASAIKYWYFIRLMGKDPSHLALECALKTHPNMVIISEESSFRGESLMDIVNRICDVV